MDSTFNKEIGLRIRTSRLERSLTREKLAESAEISVQFLCDIELGKKGMSAITLKKLCRSLGVSADYLIFGKPESDAAALYSSLNLNNDQHMALIDIVKIIQSSF